MKPENKKYVLAIASGLALAVGLTAIGFGQIAASAFGFSLYAALGALSDF